MAKQVATQKFVSECLKASLHIDNDMALGALHDFLMLVKGQIVDLMVKAHKQEEEYANEQKKVQSIDEPA